MIGTGLSRRVKKLLHRSNERSFKIQITDKLWKRLENLESYKVDDNVIEVSNGSPRSNGPFQIQMEFSGELEYF